MRITTVFLAIMLGSWPAIAPFDSRLAALAQGEQEAQAAARQKALEARAKCGELLSGLDGVSILGIAGAGTDYRLLISCRDADARLAAWKLMDSDSFQGLKILWSFQTTGSARATVAAPPANAPAAKEAPKAPAPGENPPKPGQASATDCDIIRDYMKMKPVNHPIGDGRSWIPCQLIRRSVVGAGGGHTYVYTKHRPDCPIRLGRVSQPADADNFVAWVFQKGFTPVMRGGFTWPFELRADDKWWDWQASEELKTRLPYIREGAEWSYTNSGWTKVTTPWYSGWFSTGGGPGLGWTWSQPWTSTNSDTPVPAPTLPTNPYIPTVRQGRR